MDAVPVRPAVEAPPLLSFRPGPRVARAALAAVLSLALLGLPTGASPASAATQPSAAAMVHWGSDPQPRNEQFYFVLPDRFANGDHANDRGGLSGDRLATGFDPSDKGFYHGGDLKGIIDRLGYIQGLGTTAIWLAPIFKNRPVQGSGANVSAGYHGYWITDFTQVDPHFGTKADLKRLVTLAHQRGMKIYLDIIVNHTADIIRYAENTYTYVDKATAPYRDSQGRAFEDRNYADGTRAFPPVNTASGPYTPAFASPADATAKTPAWLNDPTMYHNRGDSTFSGENSQYGDFFGLDDLWTERPEVVKGMTKIFGDWIGETGVDGYRLDTVKHTNLEFWPQFSRGIQRAADKAGKKDFFMFGEVYSADQEIESTYVRRGGLPATLDFSFQEAARAFVTGKGAATSIADMYAKDDLYTARDTGAERLPTFLGNHDMGRIGSFVASGGTGTATELRRDQLAHELMFLTRGQPVIYSGDEQGFTGPGGDKDARQDMFATKTAAYLDDDLIGTDRTHASDQYDPTHPLYRTIADLGRLRQQHPALRDGMQITRYAADGPGVFAVSRIDRQQRVEYVVASNNATTTQTVVLDTWSPRSAFRGIYGGGAAATAQADGKLSITVPALSSVAYRADRPIPVAATAPTVRITKPEAGAAVPTRAEVTAVTTGDPLATVTIAAKVGAGPWQLLGTADKAPYRVYHDLTGLPGGTKLSYQAVVRDSCGRIAATTSTATVGTPPSTVSPDYLVVHYQRPAGGYDNWGLYAFGDIDPSAQTTWPAGQPFTGEDAYGRFAWVKLKPGAGNVGFLVVDATGVKDVEADRSVDPAKNGEIWLKQGDATVYPTRAAAGGSDPAPDPGTAILHYRRADGDYTGWGLHVWDGAATPTDWAAPLQPSGSDTFGVTFRVPLAAGATGLNYIIHNGDTKDLPTDQHLDLTGSGRETWLLAGVPQRLLPAVVTAGGGVADLGTSKAVLLDRTTVAWQAGPTDGRIYDLVYAPAGALTIVNGDLAGTYSSIRLTARRNGITESQRVSFPDLWQYGAFGIAKADRPLIAKALRGQVVVTERDAGGKLLSATGVQTTAVPTASNVPLK